MFYLVRARDGETLVSREDWLATDISLLHNYSPGDVVELREGIFVLDEALMPMKQATHKQLLKCWNEEPRKFTDFDAFVEAQTPRRLP
jgi:hypothetical protein